MGRTWLSELFGEHLFRHLGDLAARQIAQLEWPKGEPDQPRHGEPEMLEYLANLAVLALAQSQRDPGVAALAALETGADRAIGYAVDRDSLLQSGEAVWIDLADMVIISEAPDDVTLAKATLSVASHGNVQTETLRAFSEKEYRGIIGSL
jgi:hypothetical protein